MKSNATKRKIFDALDLVETEPVATEGKDGINCLAIKDIKPFHDHPFHLYEGERLNDMVEHSGAWCLESSHRENMWGWI